MWKLELRFRFMSREFPEEVTRRKATFLRRCQQVFGLICFDSFLPLTTPPWQEKQLTSAKPLCLSPALRPPFMQSKMSIFFVGIIL